MEAIDFTQLLLEFFSIFFAVVFAFALNNWNDRRKDKLAVNKIMLEISNGLKQDIDDLKINVYGHERCKEACQFWREVVDGKKVSEDAVQLLYTGLFRDFILVQNTSGYEVLKSKGLELIKKDSLRYHIIDLYENEYKTLKKLEEEYEENQFFKHHFAPINSIIAPHLKYDKSGAISGISLPIKMSKEQRNIFLSHLSRIENGRNFCLKSYDLIQGKVNSLIIEINNEIR